MKQIKFPLKLKDEFPARSLDELKSHFDFEKIVEYFVEGKLLNWLESRNYTKEATAIRGLSPNDPDLNIKLPSVFGIEEPFVGAPVDIGKIKNRTKKIAILRQYTSDENVFKHVDQVAFNQEDLDKFIEENAFNDIYLCNNSFVIKMTGNKNYVGVGKVEAVVKDCTGYNFGGVSFSNVHLDAQSMFLIGCTYNSCQNIENHSLKAKAWFEKAAELGHDLAKRNIGLLYLTGCPGIPKDAAKAFNLIKEVADKISGPLNGYYMGYMYRNGEGVAKDGYKALEWFKKSAELGDTDSMTNIGCMYIDGDAIPQDSYKAIEWLRKAGDAGQLSALCIIAEIYRDGKGVPKDVNKAIEWYIKAMNAGNVIAPYNIAIIYEEGKLVPRNMNKAIEWYKKGVDMGDGASAHSIAGFYEPRSSISGDILIEDNVHKAIEWYKKGGELGYAPSYRRIGDFYQFGREGLPKDIRKAMEWYRKGADLGDTASMSSIGSVYECDALDENFYEEGRVFSKNISEGCHKALEWYQKGAALGDDYCKYQIASLYEDDAQYNRGVFTDGYQKALEWYRKIIETVANHNSFEFKQATKKIPEIEAILQKSKA